MIKSDTKLAQLLRTLPQKGRVAWIGLRPAKFEPVMPVNEVKAIAGRGLEGDRYSSQGGKRQVTLIQWEHLKAMASMLNLDAIEPDLLRRNIAVSGINLLALKDKDFRVGTAVFQYTGLCHPCSRMEAALGEGGYNAMRGHGGITVRVIDDGLIRLGDPVSSLG